MSNQAQRIRKEGTLPLNEGAEREVTQRGGTDEIVDELAG